MPPVSVPEPAKPLPPVLPLSAEPLAPLVTLPLVTDPLPATTEPLALPVALPTTLPLPVPIVVAPDVVDAPLLTVPPPPELDPLTFAAPLELALGELPQAAAARRGASQTKSLTARMCLSSANTPEQVRIMCVHMSPIFWRKFRAQGTSESRYCNERYYEERET
jgi:hypothetical protein